VEPDSADASGADVSVEMTPASVHQQ